MPKHSTREGWMGRTDVNGHLISEWCSWKEKDIFFCKICPSPISTSAKGFQALSQHASSEKHKGNAKTKLSPLQLTLAGAPPKVQQQAAIPIPNHHRDDAVVTPAAAPPGEAAGLGVVPPPGTVQREDSGPLLQLVSRKDAALTAELQWAMKCVQAAYSNNSCDNIVELFKSMFGCDKVPKDMSLGRTKVSYLITDALGPYFHKKMLDDAQKAPSFTMCFDETVNNKKVKELQCGLRFWSEEVKHIVFHHLESLFIGSATGVIVSDHLLQVLERACLCLQKFLMLSMDGPNVNKTVFRLVSEKVKEVRGKGLMDAGSCNVHILHNSFLSGLEVFGEEVSHLVIAIYEYFDGFPSRVEEYKKSQLETKVPDHVFIKHVTSRWLTLSGAAERLLEQWPAVVHFFLTVIPKSNSDSHKKIRETQRYKFIAGCLKDPTMQASVAFVIQSAKLFEGYSKLFQKSEPMIHILYDELLSLFVLLLGRFCKPSLVSTSRSCLKEEFIKNKDNLVALSDVECGDRAKSLLTQCKDVDVLKFRLNSQKHYQAAATHLLQKSVLSKWPDGKHLKCLQPSQIKEQSSPRSIVLVHRMLRLDLGVDEDVLKDEWRLLQLENLPVFEPTTRIDHYWAKIFDIVGSDGKPKFPNTVKLVKATLPIAHGSADIERGFNESSQQLRPEQTRMEERLFNAKLWVKDGLKPYGGRPDLVPITKELLAAGYRAHRSYTDHLQAKRDEEEAARKVAEEAEAERLRREKEEKQQREDRSTIESLQEKLQKSLSAEKDQRKAADELVEEATSKLDTALKKKDFAAAKVAHGMLEGAKIMREKAIGLQRQNEPLQKKVTKRTSSLIEKMFQAKRKKDPPAAGGREREVADPDDPDLYL
ncbi:uncharacterized protein LOC117649763 [Thrips palmi]|uniref:Uncharacterized protein LOC117649763 n=1 Tax=Thrips palmi TaxID=161013 RepID=A0A6P8ZTT6_THRPL|nr:uncharacterized protein LOC117649763 [Thrips palmi]